MRLLAVGHCYMDVIPRRKWHALRAIAPEMDIVVVTPQTWPDVFCTLQSSPEQCGDRLRFVPMKTAFAGYGSRHFYLSPELPRLIRAFRPHVIHVDHEPWSVACLQLTLLRRWLARESRQVVFSWSNEPKHVPFPWTMLHQLSLRSTDLVLAGNAAGPDFHRAHGYTGRIEVLPQFGVNVEFFHQGPAEAGLRAELGLRSGFVFGYVGQLRREKGIDTLLNALAAIPALDWQALIVGSGPAQGDLEEQATRLGLQDRVVFAGFAPQTEVARYMRCMSALVLPSSWEEQFGHVLVEAMACGKPVIGSDVGEIPNVIGDAGIVFRKDDHAALAQHLSTLIQREDVVLEYSRRGLARVERTYSEASIAQRLRALYHELCTADTTRGHE